MPHRPPYVKPRRRPQRMSDRSPSTAVMVPADDKHRNPFITGNACHYAVPQLHCLYRWNGAIVHITGNHYCIHMSFFEERQKLMLQHIGLVLGQVVCIKSTPQVPISRMQNTHLCLHLVCVNLFQHSNLLGISVKLIRRFQVKRQMPKLRMRNHRA